jgi:hypothetical protein
MNDGTCVYCDQEMIDLKAVLWIPDILVRTPHPRFRASDLTNGSGSCCEIPYEVCQEKNAQGNITLKRFILKRQLFQVIF